MSYQSFWKTTKIPPLPTPFFLCHTFGIDRVNGGRLHDMPDFFSERNKKAPFLEIKEEGSRSRSDAPKRIIARQRAHVSQALLTE